MNLEKFTDRAKGFLQSAQTVAIRMSHQRIGPEHLLKALLEDEQGMASGLIKAAGGDAATALRETDAALAKVPAVSGGGAQQGTEGMGATATATDDLAAVALGDHQVDHGLAAILTDAGRDLIRVLHHGTRDAGHHLGGALLAHPRPRTIEMSFFTAGVGCAPLPTQ